MRSSYPASHVERPAAGALPGSVFLFLEIQGWEISRHNLYSQMMESIESVPICGGVV
ncbi:MAG TPA: hypothetical protein PLB18_05590 [Acidobacteriota bacterium]|nr:hypothetical protein [Acidobacteriota bacterium]HNB72540.1 hypothetical protein [Acidobacteriota bacterium]HND18821.1 hypothetical protein [Acidobacteriota bacterium]HNG94212.1 hypothetical protein [Acidobacteriota bacterium]HNH82532.1 hypothetical protein [Acidobacteriota bacterium]